ncbi:hypothetical protein [Paludisphaera soli]|uniref:hypothetical protein n=1 Tax=Paludisphaera soli TaxID=2712865 RepID=UPI0013EB5B53|nr:hypothetical protein [Paludisphaera soli]
MEDHREWYEKDRLAWINRRWDQRRGVESFAANRDLVLIKASVEEVGRALAPEAAVWERDVLGREITLERSACFLFRLRGHSWTEVVDYHEPPYWDESIDDKDWRSLSKKLGTQLITFGMSDSCSSVGYTLWADGELQESFFAEEACAEDEDEEDEVAGRPEPGVSHFVSKRRATTLAEIRNIWDFAHDFLVEQDAFDPGIGFGYFVGQYWPEPGLRARVENPGLGLGLGSHGTATSFPDFERIDYIDFRLRKVSPRPS